MKSNYFKEIKTYLLLGFKFGLFGAVIGFVLHALWGNLQEVKYSIYSGFIIGLVVGLFERIFSITIVARLPYSLILFLRVMLYFIITVTSVYTFIVIYLYSNGLNTEYLKDPEKFELVRNVYFLTNINIGYILVLTITGTFIWQLKSFFSKGVLINYLIGKYHKPAIEHRIFMFLDLNDATTLAENLGSKMYSSFLSDFFHDLDIAFTKTKGHVFQYVGDEVVINWKPKDGLKNNNCLNAFFLAVKIIESREFYYLSNYKTVPTFKASIHMGEVTVTEIGVSKKDIVYHGDTLNTTSRIYSSAHKLNKQILISKTLHDRLSKDFELEFKDLGQHLLKGKDEQVHIYGIEPSEAYFKQLQRMY